MNYIQKNKKNIMIIAAGVLLLGAIVALWLQNERKHTSDDIVATVGPSTVNVGDPVSFEEKTPFGKSKKWSFGDGTTSADSKGVHVYQRSGLYQVSLTIDNKYTKVFPVLVSASIEAQAAETNTPTIIEGPSQASVFETVHFRAVSSGKVFSWRFGETGNIDGTDKVIGYSYKKPGTYLISLNTDVDDAPIQHQITVTAQYDPLAQENLPPPPVIEDVDQKIADDFKIRLQRIANGQNFNENYNYLLRTYLCNADNASVTANDKNTTFYYYCTGLQFDKNNIIQEVKTTYDATMNCVIKVEVKQSK